MAGHGHTANGQLIESPIPKAVGSEIADGTGEMDFVDGAEQVADTTEPDDVDAHIDRGQPAPSRAGVRLALAFGILAMLALGAVAGWHGYHAYQAHQLAKQREIFLQAARQSAVSMTTISYMEVEKDVQRILDTSTGSLYDDFLKRSQPFIAVVKQTQSISAGTVTSVGVESADRNQAHVLATVQVKSSSAGTAEEAPRAWRMRMTVQKVGDTAKVADVAFVP